MRVHHLKRRPSFRSAAVTVTTLAACVACSRGMTSRSTERARASAEGVVVADDSAHLYYHVVGQGQPVLIVPGALFLARDFARLSRRGTVVFYDMRNRGRSDRVADSGKISIQDDVRDLEAVRRHVGAERFIPVGWSYLGRMVLLYALEHPDRVERVIQIGPLSRVLGTPYPTELTANDSVPVPDSASLRELARLRESGMVTGDPRGYCERDWTVNRMRLVGNPRRADRVPEVCSMPNEWPVNLGPHFRWLFTSMFRATAPTWVQFQAVRVPVLTIHGTKDRNVPYGSGREWAAHLPDARLVTVPGAAHMPWLDAPDLVFDTVEEFLRGAWPARAQRVPEM